ncbi:MAG: hypothetical protein R3B09_03585 [Nannocystaceae bacterium]
MAALREKSCYALELSVGPGGSRWGELHAYTEPEHLRWVIDGFCQNRGGMSAYHGIWYGARLGVWVIQRGAIVGFVDLHPLLAVTVPGAGTAPLSDTGACDRLVVARRRQLALESDEDPDEFEEEADELDDVTFEIYEAITMALDYEALRAALPPLEAPLLASGQRTARRWCMDEARPQGIYLFVGKSVRFGSYEVECGLTLDGPIPFPPLSTIFDGDDAVEDDEEEEDDDDDDASG